MLIFTDAAWESGKASAGVVILDPVRAAFELVVPSKWVDEWTRDSEQIISQAELYAVLAARVYFRERIKNRRSLFFIDNEAARCSVIKAFSPSKTMQKLVRMFHEVDMLAPSAWWIERVPSTSNPADVPSRAELSAACETLHLCNWGTRQVQVELPFQRADSS